MKLANDSEYGLAGYFFTTVSCHRPAASMGMMFCP